MKSIDFKSLLIGFPTVKKVVYHSFLTILLGVTISVCSSLKKEESDDSTAVASSGVDITDGSDQGYMRIGKMQMVWGTYDASSYTQTSSGYSRSISFGGVNFSSAPIVSINCDVTTNGVYPASVKSVIVDAVSFYSSGWQDCHNPHYIAFGKWQ